MVDIISALQLNVPLAPLLKQGLKKALAFFKEVLKKSCSSCELLLRLLISAFQSCEFECVACLFDYIVWSVSIYCLLVIMAYFHHTFYCQIMIITLCFNVVRERTVQDLIVLKIF